MLLSKQSTLWTCCNPLKKTYTKGQKYLTNSVHPVNITLIWNVITHHYYAIVTITSPLGSRALHGFLNPAAGISSTTLLVESGTDAEDKACLWVCTPIYPNSAQWHWTQILCRKITSHLTYKAFFFTNLALCKGGTVILPDKTPSSKLLLKRLPISKTKGPTPNSLNRLC